MHSKEHFEFSRAFFTEYLDCFRCELEEEIRKEMAKIYAQLKEDMIKAFNDIDEDKNGFLTKEEIKKVLEENVDQWGCFDEEMFNKLDENDDGKISVEGNKISTKSTDRQKSQR